MQNFSNHDLQFVFKKSIEAFGVLADETTLHLYEIDTHDAPCPVVVNPLVSLSLLSLLCLQRSEWQNLSLPHSSIQNGGHCQEGDGNEQEFVSHAAFLSNGTVENISGRSHDYLVVITGVRGRQNIRGICKTSASSRGTSDRGSIHGRIFIMAGGDFQKNDFSS